jgi:hypothetical protein
MARNRIGVATRIGVKIGIISVRRGRTQIASRAIVLRLLQNLRPIF